MGVEMSYFSIHKVENNVIYGWFNLKKYNDLSINFEVENGIISYDYHSQYKEEKNSFSEWSLHEKDFYTKFILNFLEEINKINEISSFEGELIEEHSFIKRNVKEYLLLIQYSGFLTNIVLTFYPIDDYVEILYQIPIPINSEGEYGGGMFVEKMLKKETIKRMWEPFRDKTKYRLQLLHMLR